MARRLVKVCGGDLSAVTEQMLPTLDAEFPDLRAALEALASMGRKLWSDDESELLRRLYPDTDTLRVGQALGASPAQVYRRAKGLGLTKSEAFKARLAREAGARLVRSGQSTRFRPGQAPPNKGVKGWQAGGRALETQFKKGHRPHTWRPIGSEAVDADGYLKRKITEEGKPHERWRYVHLLIWEAANGPVPDGHAVVFRDGDKRNVELENLELVSRAELMRRNTIHQLPEPIKRVLFAKARLTRVIRETERRLRDA